MAYIYKIWNDINNKVYIGKTTESVQKRWKEHKKDRRRRKNEKRPLYEAMEKYGIEHFHIKTIEECGISEVNDRECYWINYYGSFKNGYNCTKGGDGKTYVDGGSILKLWNDGHNIKTICNITGYDQTTIRKYLNDYGVSSKLIKSRANQKRSIPVAMIDIKTNKILKIFKSAKNAARYLEKENGKAHIGKVCRGERHIAYGYKWKYVYK